MLSLLINSRSWNILCHLPLFLYSTFYNRLDFLLNFWFFFQLDNRWWFKPCWWIWPVFGLKLFFGFFIFEKSLFILLKKVFFERLFRLLLRISIFLIFLWLKHSYFSFDWGNTLFHFTLFINLQISWVKNIRCLESFFQKFKSLPVKSIKTFSYFVIDLNLKLSPNKYFEVPNLILTYRLRFLEISSYVVEIHRFHSHLAMNILLLRRLREVDILGLFAVIFYIFI